MSTQELTTTDMLQKVSTDRKQGQYTLWQIFGLWIAVSAPMGILTWIVFPTLKDNVGIHPSLLLWVLMIIGLMWEVS